MRISDIFVKGYGYGWDSGDFGTDCYNSGHYCHRSYDPPRAYNDPRSYRQGLAEIIGTRKYGGAGLSALFINHG